MTRIMYSIVSLLTLVMGVVSYDYWRNPYNIPMGKLGNIEEETSLFPARQIRPYLNLRCTCDSEEKFYEYEESHHPRYLVSNKCAEPICVNLNRCREVEYSFNVSSIRNEDNNGEKYSNQDKNFCRNMWKTQLRTISVACVPVQPKMQA